MKPSLFFQVVGILSAGIILSFSPKANAEDILATEDREITREYYDDQDTFMYDDGQANPVVQFVESPEIETRFVVHFDLTGYSGQQVGDARFKFYVTNATDMDYVSLKVWYFEGNDAITAEDFDAGSIQAGGYTLDTEIAESYAVNQWVEMDVTTLVNSRSRDHVYFNIRLSGGYPNFEPNVFGDQGAHHYVNLAACEWGSKYVPQLSLDGPFVSPGADRKVFGSVTLDGSGSYASGEEIVSYKWVLVCRGNAVFTRSASGQTAVVNNLRPGFYDVYLQIETQSGQTATGSFVLLSSPEVTADLDGDNDVDGQDLKVFASKYGQ